MPQRIPLPLPQYEVGDHVAIRPNEGPASFIVHGKIRSLTWNGRTGDHLYGLQVSGIEGEDPELITVHEFEIWGLIDVSAEGVGSA